MEPFSLPVHDNLQIEKAEDRVFMIQSFCIEPHFALYPLTLYYFLHFCFLEALASIG